LQASNAASVLTAAAAAASTPSAANAASAAASQHPGADVGRMLFAGHSMGGHGAWELASHMPDRALGVVSVAGWLRKEYVTLRRVMA
jgi:S-formylglutathione hydrolase FrmB